MIHELEQQATPVYAYDLSLLSKTLNEVCEAANAYNFHVHYALKANSNQPILEAVKAAGLGADCVSGNEVQAAIDAGFAPREIVFAGVGKSDQEINRALEHDIFCFNCESLQELEVINDLAARKGKRARIALRINPNVNANTHKYITTGLHENKFGINKWEFDAVAETLANSPAIELIGIHFHIGSQITDLGAFQNLCNEVNEIQNWFEGQNIQLQHLNLGGGLGINYESPDEEAIVDFKQFFALFNQTLELRPGQSVHFELGRSIVANCGNLIARTLYVKKGVQTNFVILDAGMTDLLRPALYQAAHKIENLSSRGAAAQYDVVGPICESSDCFAKNIELPETKRGDLIAIRSAGAYGEVMASRYNLRDLPPSIYWSWAIKI